MFFKQLTALELAPESLQLIFRNDTQLDLMLTATEVSATGKREDHLLYLAFLPLYPRKL